MAADTHDEHLTVTQLLGSAKRAITEELGGPVWVVGEISGLRRGRNSHTYFDLVEKDEDDRVTGLVSVALWAGNRKKVNERVKSTGPIRIDDGVQVRILGPLDIWITGGRLQFSMIDIDPTYTVDAIDSERERVIAVLRAEDLLERNRRLPLPMAPQRIGLVTAVESAAEADFLHSFDRSGLHWDIVFADSRVQGAGAERSIAAALLACEAAGVELIALVRGGGARNDLAVFDHELVGRTIAGLGVPVFTGIGHEIDTSVADLVAASAHKTPTACAEAIVELASTAADRAERAWAAIATDALSIIGTERAELSAHTHRAVSLTRSRLAVEDLRLENRLDRLRRQATDSLRRVDGDLRVHRTRLDAVDPARALARGWSITRTSTGAIVRSVGDVAPGETLLTTVGDGTITSTVNDSSLNDTGPNDTGTTVTSDRKEGN